MGIAIEFHEYIPPLCGSCRWMLEKGASSGWLSFSCLLHDITIPTFPHVWNYACLISLRNTQSHKRNTVIVHSSFFLLHLSSFSLSCSISVENTAIIEANSSERLATGWTAIVRFPVGQEFSLLHKVQIGSGAHPASWVPGDPSPGIQRQKREADCSHLSIAEVKNSWNCAFTLPYFLMSALPV
jgi:hypothetical protein